MPSLNFTQNYKGCPLLAGQQLSCIKSHIMINIINSLNKFLNKNFNISQRKKKDWLRKISERSI